MKQHTLFKKLISILPPRQKANFLLILLILALSAVLSQVTPLAVGYLTASVLTSDAITFTSVLPVLKLILVVNVVNEVIKVIRRLIVEDTATQTEKIARQKAACSLLAAPLSYFRQHMTGNIHGRLNRSLEGTVTLEQVKEAARKASIAGEIEKLPGGYEFMLSEGGKNLSGGQRQRIALARIFLKQPRILILDEATSALDNTSEKRIQQEIEAMKASCGTTVISIAHRLTTLRNCDEILVMDAGHIVQRGTYAQLERTPGIFQDIALGKLR